MTFLSKPLIKILLLFSLLSNASSDFSAQKIVGLQNVWQDSYREWVIYTDSSDVEGSLSITWELANDWTEWDFEIDEFIGSAKLKYKNDPGFWEFRSVNEIITAKTVWSNDFTEWRLSDGDHIIKLKSKYRDLPIIWYSEGENYGYIDIFMEFEDDPGIWIVEDELDANISPLYRMALIFISLFHSTPRI